jgi:hypothetical protein
VRNGYRDIVTAIPALRPDVAVLLPNHDYAIPDGRALGLA